MPGSVPAVEAAAEEEEGRVVVDVAVAVPGGKQVEEVDGGGGCNVGRVGGGLCLSSWRVQARAFKRRMRDASETRRLKRGSVARVRKVSLRILA